MVLVWPRQEPAPATPPAAPEVEADEPRQPRVPPPEAATSANEAQATRWRALVEIRGEQHAALALRGRTEREAYLLLPLHVLDASDGPATLVADPTAELTVVSWNVTPPHLLLLAQSTQALPFRAAELRPSHQLAADEWLVAPRFGRARVVGRTEAGLLRLSGAVPEDEVLVDGDGRIVALATSDLALPVDPILLWLGQPGRQTLDEVRAAMRERDPGHLAQRAVELVRQGTVAACEEAVRLLDQALALERERERLELLARHQMAARLELVRAWAATDPIRALAEVRQALAIHSGDQALLALAAQVAVQAGDPVAAAGWFRALDPQAQAKLAGRLADGLAGLARRLQKQGQDRMAWEAIEEGLLLFPEHSGLLAAQRAAASRQAPPADSGGGAVEIPFDPETNTIQTQVTVGGRTVRMVIDTGATLTTIPTNVAQALGLLAAENKRVKIETASGIVEGQLVRLPEVRIGGLRISGARAVVHDLPGSLSGSGLLGLNVLGRLDMRIDGRRNCLILRQDVSNRHR